MTRTDPPPRNFSQRSIRAALTPGPLATLFIAVYGGPRLGLIYAAAFIWIMINVFIWQYSLRQFFSDRRLILSIMWILIKTIWLLAILPIGATLDIARNFTTFSIFLFGINTPFLVFLLKAIGKWMVEKK